MSTGQDELAAIHAAPPLVFSDPRFAELYRWSRPGCGAREFEQRFLEQLRDLLGAQGAAVWFDPGGEALYLLRRRKQARRRIHPHLHPHRARRRQRLATPSSVKQGEYA